MRDAGIAVASVVLGIALVAAVLMVCLVVGWAAVWLTMQLATEVRRWFR